MKLNITGGDLAGLKTGRHEINQPCAFDLLLTERRYDTNISEKNQKISGHIMQLARMQSFSTEYDERAAVAAILKGDVKKSFQLNDVLHARNSDGTRYTHKTQTGTIEDLFDDKELKCCSFYPAGKQKSDAPLLVLDPSVSLIYLTKKIGNGPEKRIAVSINFFAYTRSDEKVLMVDNIEGDQNMMYRYWCDDFRRANERFAKDNKCSSIFYGSKPANKMPQEFIQYLHTVEKIHMRPLSSALRKEGSFDAIRQFGASKMYIESFEHKGKLSKDIFHAIIYRCPK